MYVTSDFQTKNRVVSDNQLQLKRRVVSYMGKWDPGETRWEKDMSVFNEKVFWGKMDRNVGEVQYTLEAYRNYKDNNKSNNS